MRNHCLCLRESKVQYILIVVHNTEEADAREIVADSQLGMNLLFVACPIFHNRLEFHVHRLLPVLIWNRLINPEYILDEVHANRLPILIVAQVRI
jgi:hypothetical protein